MQSQINTTLVIIETIGGLGIFLIGMIVMTEGLHALAGNAVRRALTKFTSSPISGAITGASCTALLQSSSATTVAAVGFVGAGLLTFPQALGIVFGANLGTTITGWLVVLLGFKLKLSTMMLPIIFVGAFLKLFASQHVAKLGYALAGFGLIFVGISAMQQGMASVEQLITPEIFPPDTLFGRLQLVFFGIVFTFVTQSSSAGVAVALTALFAGAINFNQAATLVIGMDIGTTVTAAMATIGGSVGSKRTGFSHVFYNLITALLALILLTPFSIFYNAYIEGGLNAHPEIALVAFHSLFNFLGVVVILPFTQQFANFICKVFPTKREPFTEVLDLTLLKEPSVALLAIFSSCKQQLIAQLSLIAAMLNVKQGGEPSDFQSLDNALRTTRDYTDLIHLQPSQGAQWRELIALIHVVDHMHRLNKRCIESPSYGALLQRNYQVTGVLLELEKFWMLIISNIEKENWSRANRLANKTRLKLVKSLEPVRRNMMHDIASGKLSIEQAHTELEALRWLQRLANHTARITYYLNSCKPFKKRLVKNNSQQSH